MRHQARVGRGWMLEFMENVISIRYTSGNAPVLTSFAARSIILSCCLSCEPNGPKPGISLNT
jgi:hypothetical protein